MIDAPAPTSPTVDFPASPWRRHGRQATDTTGDGNRVIQASQEVRGKANLVAGHVSGHIDNRRIHIDQVNIILPGAESMSATQEQPEPFYRLNEEQHGKLYTAKHLSRVIHDLAAGDGQHDRDFGVEISSRESFAVVMTLLEDLIDAGLSSEFVRPNR